ncbi:MAG: class I SAM-dependent methyltransferase [FCB group bacterium]|jgi:2-polyprenyl-3-methyl-5-hydroxy-6-metoxy-1,4-benzoquinol methylase
MKKNIQKEFLEESANSYHKTIIKDWEKLYYKKRENLFSVLKPYHLPGNALELGSADGILTQWLCKEFTSLTVVDGSELFLKQLKQKVKAKNIKLVCSLFEEWETKEKFDNIFMTHILEHLDDPVLVLKRAVKWLSKKGRIFIAVPNANSIHRLIGVKMGMLSKKDSLNEQDVILGHKRVYTPKLLKSHIRKAGLKIIKSGGCMIKPLSNRQIEAQWSNELIDAFFAISEDLPDLCSEIYIIAEKT